MADYDFILPAASQTLALSRTNWNGSFDAVLKNFYGTAVPAATDINDQGTTGLVEGMWYRDSANGAVYIRDSGAFKGGWAGSGHVTGNFTRVGIGTRVVSTLAVGAALAGPDHTAFSAFEVGELLCTVGDSAGSANNRLYLKTANTAKGISDVSIPPDGGIGVAKLNFDAAVVTDVDFTMRNLKTTANATYDIGTTTVGYRNLYVTSSIYCKGALAIGNGGLVVTGPTTSTGVYKAPNGSVSAPAYSFSNDTDTGFYFDPAAGGEIRLTAAGAHRFGFNTTGIFPSATTTYNIGSASLKFLNMYATNFNGQATTALYADLAERFEADEVLEEGDVVMIGGEKEITKTDRESTPEVFGVISTQPAYAMNSEGGTDETHPYVALVGKVPVKVTGKVLKGQRLVASSQAGIAIAAETKNIFAVVGRALESSEELGIKLINAAVGKL